MNASKRDRLWPIASLARCKRFVSPHPNPRPRGEGTASLSQWKADNGGLGSEQRTVHPLPKGEGRGRSVKQAARVSPIPEMSNLSSSARPEVYYEMPRLL